MNEITANNIVEKIIKEVKQYPQEPFYMVYVANSLCVYELLVNDYPIRKQYEYEQLATPIYINNAILKTGKQKITLRLYPAPAEYNGGKDTFSPNTKCNLEVFVNDHARGLPVGEKKLIVEQNLPTKTRMGGTQNNIAVEEFVAKGEKYYEYSFYFEATVPYENEGWTNGQDLTKLKKEELEKVVIDYYKNYKNIYVEKNANLLAKSNYGLLVRNAKSDYQDAKYIKETWDEYLEMVNIEKDFMPLENYKLNFYGDGKIVCLLNSETKNVRLRGKSSLWFKCDTPNGKMRRFVGLYLYLPQGKKLNELEVIR